MANRRKIHLDALERRLTGPKRIALFGHRDVGKTTLLAMFYRQASTGRVPGIRLAAIDPATAEYLAEKIGRIESGEPPAGTLAETELKLRLYHNAARFDLIVKDYQGEHVTLGSDEPIQAFFADCDAVFLCLDPEGPANSAERRRRQQEVENLLERYIDRSEDGTTGLPLALLLTKFDRVARAHGLGDDPGAVERLVEARYGMTRHALASHCPRSAMFAVSSYGAGSVDGRPPAELHPMNLEGPLGWLAEELEAGDLDRLGWLWDLAPTDLPRLARCTEAIERRYPKSDRPGEFRRRLTALRSRQMRRRLATTLAGAAFLTAALAGYDLLAFRSASAFEHASPPPSAVAARRRWSDVVTWHPSLRVFFPDLARRAKSRVDDWTVREAADRVAAGDHDPAMAGRLRALKVESPGQAPAIRAVEADLHRAREDAAWDDARSQALASGDESDAPLAAVRGFLLAYPDSPHKDKALQLRETLQARSEDRQARLDRLGLDDLIRAEGLPDADLRDLISRGQQLLAEHPQSRTRPEVDRWLQGLVRKLDDQDIEKARGYSAKYPTNFPTRIARFDDYLKAHQSGGRYIGEAIKAKEQVLRDWDAHVYRQAYDHLVAHPDDVAEVARRLREYLTAHPRGRRAADAQGYLAWWDKVAAKNPYQVTLRRGIFDPKRTKTMGGAGPNLDVTIEVGGISYGPTPTVPDTAKPIWSYRFKQPIIWGLNDPVTIRVTDRDWSDSQILILNSRKGDPLAIRNLSGPGPIKPSTGGMTALYFESDFRMPKLGKPD